MNLQVIHEHTVDVDLLPEQATIIDLGCRGFDFTYHFDRLEHLVWPVDIDVLSTDRAYDKVAITGENGRVGIKHNLNDPQATAVKEGSDIDSMTLERYMEKISLEFADLIKMDVEGSEKDIILNLTKAPAKQLSIEFHLHCNVYSQPDVALMVGKLRSLGYKTVQHNLENRHGAGFNFWDSLFVLE